MPPLNEQIVKHHHDCYNAIVNLINALPSATLDKMLRAGFCPVPVEHLLGVGMGMFHCDICGTMVVAGFSHPQIDPPWNPEISLAAQDFYSKHPELR